MKVLHVVESFGGGVANALLDYVISMPSAEHHLLMRVRADSAIDVEHMRGLFTSVELLPDSFLDSRTSVRRAVRSIRPSVVHCHSSFAGAFVRSSVRSTKSSRIVYTPHCYAFERRDVPRVRRALFFLAEAILSWNTDVVAACSPREAELARALRPNVKTVYVPNVSPMPSQIAHESPDNQGRRSNGRDLPVVVAVGRLSAQKDPMFFADTIDAIREVLDVRAVWIGGGNDSYARRLAARGIEVTGWLNQSTLRERMLEANVYLHTAAWEGLPLSLLEAHTLDLPMVVRRVPSTSWVDQAVGAASAREIAALARSVLDDSLSARSNRARWREQLAANNKDAQAKALQAAYRNDCEQDGQPIAALQNQTVSL